MIPTYVTNDRPYTRLDQETILSFTDSDALALWTYLRSRPPTWKVEESEVRARFGWGHKLYVKAMRILEQMGLKRKRYIRDSKGLILSSEVIIYPVPQSDSPLRELSDVPDSSLDRQSPQPTVGAGACLLRTDVILTTEVTPKREREAPPPQQPAPEVEAPAPSSSALSEISQEKIQTIRGPASILPDSIPSDWEALATRVRRGSGLDDCNWKRSWPRFVAHHRGKGSQSRDWIENWRLWVIDEDAKRNPAPAQAPAQATAQEQPMSAYDLNILHQQQVAEEHRRWKQERDEAISKRHAGGAA